MYTKKRGELKTIITLILVIVFGILVWAATSQLLGRLTGK